MTEEEQIEPPVLIRTLPTVGDLVGAVSVALVLIPQAIAYADIAGLPPECGLFAATLPLLVAAPLVSCPWLQTGPVALTSLLTAGALGSIVLSSESAGQAPPATQLAGAAALLAVIVGCTRFLLGVFRLGGVTQLLSPPVVLGFTTGAAILIVSSQVPKALGTQDADPNVLVRAFKSVVHLQWSPMSIAFALATAAIVHFAKKIHKLFPAILLAVVIAILASHWVGYTGSVVGKMEGGFIAFNFQLPFSQLDKLLLPGVVIAIVGFAEPASIALTLMGEAKMKWNPSRELCGGGLANIVSGLIGGYPVGGSLSRSLINKYAGASTAWSGLFTGALMIAALGLTPYLAKLPSAAVSAIIIVAVSRLIRIRQIFASWYKNKTHCGLSIATLAATLVSAPQVDRGILLGVILGIAVTQFEKWRNQRSDGDDVD